MSATDDTASVAIPIVAYADLEVAHQYLVRTFGFRPLEIARDGDGRVVHAEVGAGNAVVWLHQENAEFSSPRTLGAATGMVAVLVDDVDAHHRQAVEAGADVRYAPVDQPYGYREYSAVDPEGHLWSFMKTLA